MYSETNFVYWLNQHLMKNFQISLESIVQNGIPSTKTGAKLWLWTKNNMSHKFRYRAYLAGYPDKYFSFHSLRSGKYIKKIINIIDNINKFI